MNIWSCEIRGTYSGYYFKINLDIVAQKVIEHGPLIAFMNIDIWLVIWIGAFDW